MKNNGQAFAKPEVFASIHQDIIAILMAKACLAEGLVDADMMLCDLGMDSLCIAEAVYCIEEHFRVTLPIDNWCVLKTYSINGLARDIWPQLLRSLS
jgi:acyl carrier protein